MIILLRKLDYVLDDDGFISMLIYNTHPPGRTFISPKYFPREAGPWRSQEMGLDYDRFEYYWNLKQNNNVEGGVDRVYKVDKNPVHDYAMSVFSSFNRFVSMDPCHGVPMIALPVEKISRYYDSMDLYKRVNAKRPPHLDKFGHLLDLVRDAFDEDEIGITGSYLYRLYQDFSDLNIVVYDASASQKLFRLLSEHGGILLSQEVPLLVPGTDWVGWRVDPAGSLPRLIQEDKIGFSDVQVSIQDRFIGSIHDRNDPEVRAGFWVSNTEDVRPYGTFAMQARGIALIRARIEGWERGMPSGHFDLRNIEILGAHNVLPGGQATYQEELLQEACKRLDALQIIGEFNREFLFDEEIVAFGLVQEISDLENGVVTAELLVGGRETGGWAIPSDLAFTTGS